MIMNGSTQHQTYSKWNNFQKRSHYLPSSFKMKMSKTKVKFDFSFLENSKIENIRNDSVKRFAYLDTIFSNGFFSVTQQALKRSLF